MGLRGLTVVFPSGDDGLGSVVDPSVRCSKAWPEWPASSPYVTTVGASILSSGKEVVCSTAAGSIITSGGGFSNVNNRATKVLYPPLLLLDYSLTAW